MNVVHFSLDMSTPERPKDDEYRTFEQLTRKLVGVPKKELNRKRAIYNAKKKKPGKRRKAE